MVTQVTYVRNPYPVPDISQEGRWIPRGPVLGDKVSPKDRDWDLKVTAHERLFAHHTLSSIRRHCRLYRPEEPRDSLDIVLSAVYAHNKDILVPKEYLYIQPETLGKETWRVLRNELKIVSPLLKRIEGPKKRVVSYDNGRPLLKGKPLCYRGPIVERRIHPSSVKLSIEGPHRDQSNPGYSRKIDGTLYSI